MFNFFSEIKKELRLPSFEGEYNIVNMSGKAVYAEGQKGLLMLSDDQVMFKVKNKIVSIYGKKLKLKDMTSQTLCVVGEIERIEVE